MRIAVLDDYQDVARAAAPWAALGPDAEVTFFADHVADDETLARRLEPFDVVVAMRERTPFTAERLARLPGLRLLVTTGMGNAAIDMDAARAQGVTVSGTNGLASPTAELTWGLILALLRSIPAEDANVRAGGWQTSLGVELAGRTLGVLGLGRLGTRVARVARAFDMDVVAWSHNLDTERAEEAGARLVTRDELFAEADIVTIHLPLSDRTRGLVGAAELERLGPAGYLVNTSRGPIVDEAALLSALGDGTIAGAALDVYDTEPLAPDHPLRTAPNTVLTPHLGYVTTGTYELFFRDVVGDIAGWANGEPVRVLNA